LIARAGLRAGVLTFGAAREQSPDESSFLIRPENLRGLQPRTAHSVAHPRTRLTFGKARPTARTSSALITGTSGEQAPNESAIPGRNECGTPVDRLSSKRHSGHARGQPEPRRAASAQALVWVVRARLAHGECMVRFTNAA
jgi:hypothetical protein